MRKRHPVGGFKGLGTSPCRTIRLLALALMGSAMGIAEIRMQASCYQLVAVCQLYHFAQVHNADTVGDMFYDREVMCDEQIGQSHLLLQLLEHIHHLCLD